MAAVEGGSGAEAGIDSLRILKERNEKHKYVCKVL